MMTSPTTLAVAVFVAFAAVAVVSTEITGVTALPAQVVPTLTRINRNALLASHSLREATETRLVLPAAQDDASTLTTTRIAAGAPQASFDLSLASQALLLSSAAYCRNSVPSWSCGPCKNSTLWGYSGIKTFYAQKTDTFGFVAVAKSHGYVVVSFEGSHDIQQFIEDLKFFKVDTQYPGAGPNVKVHGGFYQSYEIVSTQIRSMVSTYLQQNPGFKVLVTGHSLGAAIAVFCTLDLVIEMPNVQVYHYTFGQPRVGNPDFFQFYSKHAKAASFRFTHNHDIVPHLPLEDMGFHHIATEVFYKNYAGPSSLHICNGSGEDDSCSDQFLVDLSVSDHLNYLGYPLTSDSC